LKADQLAAGRTGAASDLTVEDAATLREARRLCGSVPLLAALKEWAKARAVCGDQLLPAAKAYAEANGTARHTMTLDEAITEFLAAKRRQGVDVRASYLKVLPRLAAG